MSPADRGCPAKRDEDRAGARAIGEDHRRRKRSAVGPDWSGLSALVSWLIAAALLAVFVLIAVQSAADGALATWDAHVLEDVVVLRTVLGGRIFWAFTLLGTTPVVIALTVAVSILLALWGRRAYAFLFAVGVGVAAGVSSLLKVALQRMRPPETLALIEMPTSRSLPSGHALVMGFFVGLLLLIVLKTWTGAPGGAATGTMLRLRGARRGVRMAAVTGFSLAGVSLAGAIGASRVYLGVHWLSDVVAGWCVAGLLLLVFWKILKAWEKGLRKPADATPSRSPHARAATLIVLLLAIVAVLVLTALAEPLLVQKLSLVSSAQVVSGQIRGVSCPPRGMM